MAKQNHYSDDYNKLPGKQPRLIIDISPDLLQRIKIAAANKKVSIQEYVENILDQVVPSKKRERGRLNSAAIEDLLKTREEILHERQGKPFTDSTELIRQMREERSNYLGEL
jgi:hypothetical protein